MRNRSRTIQVRTMLVSVVGLGFGTMLVVGWGVAVEQ